MVGSRNPSPTRLDSFVSSDAPRANNASLFRKAWSILNNASPEPLIVIPQISHHLNMNNHENANRSRSSSRSRKGMNDIETTRSTSKGGINDILYSEDKDTRSSHRTDATPIFLHEHLTEDLPYQKVRLSDIIQKQARLCEDTLPSKILSRPFLESVNQQIRQLKQRSSSPSQFNNSQPTHSYSAQTTKLYPPSALHREWEQSSNNLSGYVLQQPFQRTSPINNNMYSNFSNDEKMIPSVKIVPLHPNMDSVVTNGIGFNHFHPGPGYHYANYAQTNAEVSGTCTPNGELEIDVGKEEEQNEAEPPEHWAYTTIKTIQNVFDAAGHIASSFMAAHDTLSYTAEELYEGEHEIMISLMRTLGVPQTLRHKIYYEVLGEMQAISAVSGGTFSMFGTLTEWLVNGEVDSDSLKEKARQLALIHAEVDPACAEWKEFESDVSFFTNIVGSAMHLSYKKTAQIARHCSETLFSLGSTASSCIFRRNSIAGGDSIAQLESINESEQGDEDNENDTISSTSGTTISATSSQNDEEDYVQNEEDEEDNEKENNEIMKDENEKEFEVITVEDDSPVTANGNERSRSTSRKSILRKTTSEFTKPKSSSYILSSTDVLNASIASKSEPSLIQLKVPNNSDDSFDETKVQKQAKRDSFNVNKVVAKLYEHISRDKKPSPNANSFYSSISLPLSSPRTASVTPPPRSRQGSRIPTRNNSNISTSTVANISKTVESSTIAIYPPKAAAEMQKSYAQFDNPIAKSIGK